MSSSLGIRLLGGFSLTRDDRPVAGVTRSRAQALIAYLVLHCHTAQPRQRIAFHLWPNSTDAQARANLRKELSGLRRALPNADQYLLTDAKTLQWSPNASFTLDVTEFETAVQSAEQIADVQTRRLSLERAIHLYRGNLLLDCGDDWVLPERERLRQLQGRALDRLISLLTEQQAYSTALTYAQQLLRLDSLNEAAYCGLMQLHQLTGDRAGALQIYHQCLMVLREELGVDPSAKTRRLYEQLLQENKTLPQSPRRDANTAVSPHPSLLSLSPSKLEQSPLVGREQVWKTLRQWASPLLQLSPSAVTGGKAAAQALLLLGEPGIGKTRLLEELRATVQVEQVQVLWGGCFAAEMMRPYGLWIDALRSATIAATDNLSPELGFLLPELGQPTQALSDPSLLFDAVVQSLMAWIGQSPLLLLLDDIQWMDEASSALLHYGIRVLRHAPVWVACTARAGELAANAAISRVLQALRREHRLQTLELPPLDREQTAELIRSTGTMSPATLSLDLANQVFMDSGGNPLFALEIARSLGQDQPRQGSTIEALICDRIGQLDDPAREFLPWAAALGRRFQPSTVAQVADYPMPKLLSAIEQLEQQAVIRPTTSLGREVGYDFAHDIVRQVVYQQLSEPRRQLIHWQIAHKLQQQATLDDMLASDIAYHAGLGGDHALAVSAALAAAERCLKLFAYTEAWELAQQGVQHCQFLDPSTQWPLQANLLKVCALAGVTGDLAAHLENDVQQLIQTARSLGLVEAETTGLETLVILQFDRSNFTGVHQYALQIAAASRIATPAAAARLLAYSGSCLAEIGRDMSRAEALLLEAQTLADRVGLELCDLASGLGCVHRHHGRYGEARSLLRQAWRLTQNQQDHWREFTYLSYLAMTELEVGDPMAALPYCDEMSGVATKIVGEGSEGAIAQALAALAHYRLEPIESEPALTQAIAALQQMDAKRMLAYVLIGAAEIDLSHNRLGLAVQRAAAALKNAQIVNHPSEIALSGSLLIQGLLAQGEQQQAVAQFEGFHSTLDRHSLSLPAQQAIDQVQRHLQPQISAANQAPISLDQHSKASRSPLAFPQGRESQNPKSKIQPR